MVPPDCNGLAVPVIVAEPDALPALVAVMVTVALWPSVKPLTVNGRLEPLGVPETTDPSDVVAPYRNAGS